MTAAGNPATDDLRIAGLVLTKEFTDDPVIPGATVTLRFVISNVSATEDATSISFTDDIGATLSGLAVILPLTTGTCDGTLVDLFGVLTYFGGSLIAGASCTFDVTLAVPIGAASGTYANSTASLVSSPTPPAPSGFFAIMSGSGSLVFFDDARDDLIVNSSLLALTKEFTDDPVSPGDTVTLEFTLTNLSTSETVTDIAFTDDLAAILPGTPDVTVISVDANDCGGTVGGVGTSLIDFSGGTLAPADSCTIELSLSVPGGAPTGTFPNVTSDVTGTAGGLAVTGAPTSDDLLIQTLTFTKSFDGPTVAGGTPRLTFTIVNLSTSTVSDLEFTDNLDAVISGLEATSLPKSSICGASSMIVGTDFLAFTGGELLPLGTCSFFVDLLVPATATAGTFPNTTSDLFVAGLPAADPATASLVVGEPSIDVEKSTNDEDADAPAGPLIAVGDPVTWTYDVTNTGDVTLTDITVVDDKIGAVPGSPIAAIAPGEVVTLTATETAVPGPYANSVTVAGDPGTGTFVSDSDPSHYFGVEAAISIEKATNGFDADAPPGPPLLVGSTVTWRYFVTNNGNVDLDDVSVSDDVIGPIACPQTTLAAGESMTCTAVTGVVLPGPYANVATVTGRTPLDDVVSDSNPSHYFGLEAAISIEKATNGFDADAPPGPPLRPGSTVTWSYFVTNNGNVAIDDISVSDDKIGPIACPQTTLAAGESMTCTAVTGVVLPGQYVNVATVTGVAAPPPARSRTAPR